MNTKELQAYNKSRKITQICYVTRDYKKMIRFFTKHLNWGPWSVGIDDEICSDACYVEGKRLEHWKYYFAVTMIGDVEIEVVQPINGPDHFEKFLNEKGEGLHHIKESINGKENMIMVANHMQNSGLKNIYQCGYHGETYLFLDTYNETGSYYELSDRIDGNGELDDNSGFIETYPHPN